MFRFSNLRLRRVLSILLSIRIWRRPQPIKYRQHVAFCSNVVDLAVMDRTAATMNRFPVIDCIDGILEAKQPASCDNRQGD
jgi:hypothetical protein